MRNMKKMKILRLIIVLSFIIGLTQGCKTLRIGKAKKETFKTQLTAYQNGNQTYIDQTSQTIEVKREGFSLRFYNQKYDSENKKFYSAQIAAFIDKSELDKIKIGMSKSDLPCFEPGSGMAPDRSGKYETLIFNNSGHHYIPYENSESKRVNLLEEANGLVKLEFEINVLYCDNQEVKVTDTELNEFYLAFLIDKNLNGIIDKGEINKISIKIK